MSICRADGVWFSYRPGRWILEDVHLDVPDGGFLTIIGASGSGKTTLMKLLAGLLAPGRGAVELLGVHRPDRHPELRPEVGYIPQQLGLVRGLTALENVLLGSLGRSRGLAPLAGVFPQAEVERARACLDLLGILPRAGDRAFRLSGGERQRVAIARTLLQHPRIVFADEFVSDLDLPRAAQVLRAMRDLGRREGIAFVVNLHDIPLVKELCDDVLVLREGRIVHRGPAGSLTTTEMCQVMA